MNTMNFVRCLFAALSFFVFTAANAQNPLVSESGNPINEGPRDAIYTQTVGQRLPLAHAHVEERDVMWEKRIWREIDVRELRNQHFANINRYFSSILIDAAKAGDVTAYSALDDKFTTPLTQQDLSEMLYTTDTIPIYNMTTEVFENQVIQNDFNPADVMRYRIKEVWYVDSRTSRMNVRILGIAPIVNRYDENGNFVASIPMCWFYFDELRTVLAKEPCINNHNDYAYMSWDDVFMSRNFGSYITKKSNLRDARLQDIYSGVDVLLESDKIHQEIFNYEQDLYSY